MVRETLLLLSMASLGAAPEKPILSLPAGPAGSTAQPADVGEIGKLIAALDAADFAVREEATRRLASCGAEAIPCLVDALGHGSSELRFRARILLSSSHTFEEVTPHLVGAIEKPHGSLVRTILWERAVQHLDSACGRPHVDKLFAFWGMDVGTYRVQTLTRFTEAQTCADVARSIEPLTRLNDVTTRFNRAISQLESLSLSYDHQYSPGFVIAETLARGLQQNHARWTDFAERYVNALTALAAELQRNNAPRHAIRKEVSDRANMSQGAASYLVQLLDPGSRQREVLSRRIGIPVDRLIDDFCDGLASSDSVQCDRGVGKVHIVDMLGELLLEWPNAPQDGVVERLIAATKQTAMVGDKPKALAYLDALAACQRLASHRLGIESGLGRQLSERLYRAALEAPNNRVYHPARDIHNKLVALIDMGITPEHSAFPRELCDEYLRGTAQATADDQRLALERYQRILERLRTAGLSLEQAGVEQFMHALRQRLTTRYDLLAISVSEVDRLLRDQQAQGRSLDANTIDRALAQWTAKVVAR